VNFAKILHNPNIFTINFITIFTISPTSCLWEWTGLWKMLCVSSQIEELCFSVATDILLAPPQKRLYLQELQALELTAHSDFTSFTASILGYVNLPALAHLRLALWNNLCSDCLGRDLWDHIKTFETRGSVPMYKVHFSRKAYGRQVHCVEHVYLRFCLGPVPIPSSAWLEIVYVQTRMSNKGCFFTGMARSTPFQVMLSNTRELWSYT
jgi:hypothetical protein